MNYKHLSIEERCCLREYYTKGYSYRKIAKLMGRNDSTISRELNRNFSHMYDIPTYYPHTAQKKYKFRRSFCQRGMFQDPQKLEYIKEKLLLSWGRLNKYLIRLVSRICLQQEQYTAGYTKSI